jgi:hypothetical protein
MKPNQTDVNRPAPQTFLKFQRKLASTFRAPQHRNYRLFFFGQIVSLSGTWMQSVAQSRLVYRLTGSVALLGLISFAAQFPIFLLTAFGGARRIVIALQMTGGEPAQPKPLSRTAASDRCLKREMKYEIVFIAK